MRYGIEVREIETPEAKVVDWLRSSRIVLDLGCGEGYYSRFLRENGVDVVSLDVDEHPLKAMDPAAPRMRGDAHSLPLRTGSVGSVLSIYTLEHFRSAEACIVEIRRVLHEGGRLLIAVPCRKGVPGAAGELYKSIVHYWDRLLSPSSHSEIEQNFSYGDIISLLQNGGFRVLKSVHGDFVGTTLLLRIFRQSHGLKSAHVALSRVIEKLHLTFLLINSVIYCEKESSETGAHNGYLQEDERISS